MTTPKKYSAAYNFAALISGVLFALGLGYARMIDPSKVQGFLDLSDWQPQLMGVMIGGIIVYALTQILQRNLKKPIFYEDWKELPKTGFNLPTEAKIGGALFGIGWGLSGFCPGPAIVSAVTLNSQVFVYLSGMIFGFIAHSMYVKRLNR